MLHAEEGKDQISDNDPGEQVRQEHGALMQLGAPLVAHFTEHESKSHTHEEVHDDKHAVIHQSVAD
ncbi:hypothetical protein D3C81_1944750 [compost metagenome]